MKSVQTAHVPLTHDPDIKVETTNKLNNAAQFLQLRDRIMGIDQRVPILNGSSRPYINLDNAASTPVLREVLDTVNQFMNWYASVHRGNGFKNCVATKAYEDPIKFSDTKNCVKSETSAIVAMTAANNLCMSADCGW